MRPVSSRMIFGAPMATAYNKARPMVPFVAKHRELPRTLWRGR